MNWNKNQGVKIIVKYYAELAIGHNNRIIIDIYLDNADESKKSVGIVSSFVSIHIGNKKYDSEKLNWHAKWLSTGQSEEVMQHISSGRKLYISIVNVRFSRLIYDDNILISDAMKEHIECLNW